MSDKFFRSLEREREREREAKREDILDIHD